MCCSTLGLLTVRLFGVLLVCACFWFFPPGLPCSSSLAIGWSSFLAMLACVLGLSGFLGLCVGGSLLLGGLWRPPFVGLGAVIFGPPLLGSLLSGKGTG